MRVEHRFLSGVEIKKGSQFNVKLTLKFWARVETEKGSHCNVKLTLRFWARRVEHTDILG